MLGPNVMFTVQEGTAHLCLILPWLQGQLLLIRPGLPTATSSKQLSLLSLSSPSTVSPACMGRLDLGDIRAPKEGVTLHSVHSYCVNTSHYQGREQLQTYEICFRIGPGNYIS